ncbi:MAG: hypothetical protein ACFFAZ_12630, partial [Promethearchaeota archaeon]
KDHHPKNDEDYQKRCLPIGLFFRSNITHYSDSMVTDYKVKVRISQNRRKGNVENPQDGM